MKDRVYKEEWFNEEYFWQQYAPIMFDRRHWEEVPYVVDGIIRFSATSSYSLRILDLCCGVGRITLEFARRGFSVTGVDITRAFLETAQDDALYENLNIEFIREDIRSFNRPNYFDLITSLYISFGYFENPEDDKLVLKNVFNSLKDGGVFILETLGKEIAARDFVEREWFPKAGYTMLTEYTALDSWEMLKNRWILLKDGKSIERTFSQRLYSASELRRLLFEAGFSSVEVYGDWDASPYDHSAKTLILVARSCQQV